MVEVWQKRTRSLGNCLTVLQSVFTIAGEQRQLLTASKLLFFHGVRFSALPGIGGGSGGNGLHQHVDFRKFFRLSSLLRQWQAGDKPSNGHTACTARKLLFVYGVRFAALLGIGGVKRTLWEVGTRVSCIVVAPGKGRPAQRCARPVSTIDLFPALVELCALPKLTDLDGGILLVLLDYSEGPSEPAITVDENRHVAVRDDRYRYIL